MTKTLVDAALDQLKTTNGPVKLNQSQVEAIRYAALAQQSSAQPNRRLRRLIARKRRR